MASFCYDKNMPLQLVEVRTSDGLPLPGLLFEPETATKKVALYLHGNGSSSVFYSVEETNTMAKQLNKAGIAYFPFNNRGAHLIHKLDRLTQDGVEREPYGMIYELIHDCVQDIDGAVKYLKGLGYTTFYLIGSSTGANKICVYNHYEPRNVFSKYVMLSGGDDSGIYYEEFGKERFMKIIETAKKEVAKGNGRTLVSSKLLGNDEVWFSHQSILDIINPDGDYNTFPFNDFMNKLGISSKPLFKYYSEITKPFLVLYGSDDEYCYGDTKKVLAILKDRKNSKAEAEFEIIQDADHGFTGSEQELANIVTSYLAQ